MGKLEFKQFPHIINQTTYCMMTHCSAFSSKLRCPSSPQAVAVVTITSKKNENENFNVIDISSWLVILFTTCKQKLKRQDNIFSIDALEENILKMFGNVLTKY